MEANKQWRDLGWRHPLWDLLRFYLSLGGRKNTITDWPSNLKQNQSIAIENDHQLPIDPQVVDLLFQYLEERNRLFAEALGFLRNEEEALDFCDQRGFAVKTTATQSRDHYQSSKAMIAAVSGIADEVCEAQGYELDRDPQKRCIWCLNNELHVSARNLDGAIPSLVNPKVIWEIKEYWGKTKGGSKMSDAVYECHLVGLELREYEERSKEKITHIVFLDGKVQWEYRPSDLKRFIDLLNQGFIDHLIIGRELETSWKDLLTKLLK